MKLWSKWHYTSFNAEHMYCFLKKWCWQVTEIIIDSPLKKVLKRSVKIFFSKLTLMCKMGDCKLLVVFLNLTYPFCFSPFRFRRTNLNSFSLVKSNFRAYYWLVINLLSYFLLRSNWIVSKIKSLQAQPFDPVQYFVLLAEAFYILSMLCVQKLFWKNQSQLLELVNLNGFRCRSHLFVRMLSQRKQNIY